MDVYYLEDDESIAQNVKEFLEKRGYKVSIFPTIAEAGRALERALPSLMLVDWNMPDGSGNMFCRQVRAGWKELPIIFLTVRGDARDIVSGFQNGADDYVVKPFELEVLYSRIGALLRRTGNVSKRYLCCGEISLDQEKRRVCCGQEEVGLTPTEYELLLYLLQNKGKIVTRKKLLEGIWDSNGNFVTDNALTVTMKRLREKLHQPANLKTVRSIGYCIEEIE